MEDTFTRNLEVSVDYGQVYIYDPETQADAPDDALERAFDDGPLRYALICFTRAREYQIRRLDVKRAQFVCRGPLRSRLITP